MQAQDVMTTKVTTIETGATVREAAKRMLARRVSALPVVDDRGRVIGIVSEGDLVRRAELGTEVARSWWLRMFAEDEARDYIRTHGASVADVMSTPAIGVRRATPLHEVARLMEKHRVKRLPVLEAGRLVGIVSRADLVRRIATAPVKSTPRTKGDRALRKAVLDEVKRAGVDATYANVTVDGGTVHLWGGLRTEVEQKALRTAAKSTAGRRKVEDHTVVLPPLLVAGLGAV
jgi:CBS domain-containing protein